MAVNSQLEAITQRIRERSQTSRQVYLERLEHEEQFARLTHLSCGNIAHGVAGCSQAEQQRFLKADARNYGIVSAYNDVLSAHEPYQHFPELIKKTFLEMGHGCQFAGGVPAMCDGVTQGQIGMELWVAGTALGHH